MPASASYRAALRRRTPRAAPARCRDRSPERALLRHSSGIMREEAFRAPVENHIGSYGLVPPGGEIVCLVSGGPDSPCLWHVLRELGYHVSALHVDHGLRGAESDRDAEFCRDVLGAEVVDGR